MALENYFDYLLLISALTPLLIFLDYNKKSNIKKAYVFAGVFYAIWLPIMLFVFWLPVLSVFLTLFFVVGLLIIMYVRKKK